ncbi:MAG: hypothetical protein HRT47_05645 [Candidatus Caenarcaniphilales bacterium]|nr:hypothetical protein [Candidatus Caenarcaniphilales bacterium]
MLADIKDTLRNYQETSSKIKDTIIPKLEESEILQGIEVLAMPLLKIGVEMPHTVLKEITSQATFPKQLDKLASFVNNIGDSALSGIQDRQNAIRSKNEALKVEESNNTETVSLRQTSEQSPPTETESKVNFKITGDKNTGYKVEILVNQNPKSIESNVETEV